MLYIVFGAFANYPTDIKKIDLQQALLHRY